MFFVICTGIPTNKSSVTCRFFVCSLASRKSSSGLFWWKIFRVILWKSWPQRPIGLLYCLGKAFQCSVQSCDCYTWGDLDYWSPQLVCNLRYPKVNLPNVSLVRLDHRYIACWWHRQSLWSNDFAWFPHWSFPIGTAVKFRTFSTDVLEFLKMSSFFVSIVLLTFIYKNETFEHSKASKTAAVSGLLLHSLFSFFYSVYFAFKPKTTQSRNWILFQFQ